MNNIETINSENFSSFGRVIEYPRKDEAGADDNLFHIVIKENSPLGWRIAFLVVRDKSIDKLEQHPDSFESFEPVSGRSLLFVSENKDQSEIRCFRLTKPVILHKGIWHGVVTLDYESEIKITENAEVECVYWPLGTRLHSDDKSPGVIADPF